MAGRRALVLFVVVGALAARGVASAAVVTVRYEAEAVTVHERPFGMEVPRETPVHGYFTFDTAVLDHDPSPAHGEYPQPGRSGFRAVFLGTTIRGSSTAYYEVDFSGSGDDTFRVVDGPAAAGPQGGVMTIDAAPDPELRLFFAATDDVFDDDDLKNPFPLYDFGFLGTPHTFALEDDDGTMLLKIHDAHEVRCGDPGEDGAVTAADALQALKASVGALDCLPCVCDVDASGSISAADALRTLKRAVGGPKLRCAACN